MKKLYIGTPCYDAMVSMQYTLSLLKLTKILEKNNIQYNIDFIGNESLITRARNNILYRFMQSDFTHLLFIDADIEFTPDAVIDMLKFDKDVVACTYPKKGFNWNKFMYSMQFDKSNETLESRGLDFNYNIKTDENNIIKKDDYIQVNHISTGFMMIKKEIINKVIKNNEELVIMTNDLSNESKKQYGLFCCMIKDKMYLSEDYSFCDRVSEVGGEIWMNIKHDLTHYGKYGFKGNISNRSSYIRTTTEKMFYK